MDPSILGSVALVSQTNTAGGFSGEGEGKLCSVIGCKKGHVNKKCMRQVCAMHCRMMGGCSINQHTIGNTPKSDEHYGLPTPASETAVPSHLMQPQPEIPPPTTLPSSLNEAGTTLTAEPPSSMNPLPNRRFASQMRPIFTEQMAVE